MKTLFRFIVLVLLVAGWGLAALSLHVVRAAGDRIVLIPKQKLAVTDTYVDARTWTIDNVADHPDLFERVLQSGKGDSFKYLVPKPDGDVTEQLAEALRSAPPTTRPDDLQRAKTALNNVKKRAATTAGNWWETGK